ncbi:AT-rich interactive domain-containing protein 2 [Massospora cicadina]|nr:AT-rich interactive domain-containing protein 2 [Massospora cicadina]
MSQTEGLSHLILDSIAAKENQLFLEKLKAHSKKTGASFKAAPIFLNREINLYGLYQAVTSLGGYHKQLCDSSEWKRFTPPGELQTKASPLIRVIYKKYLLAYERDHFKGYPRLSLACKHEQNVPLDHKTSMGSNPTLLPDSSLQHTLREFYFGSMNEEGVETSRIALALESGLPNEVEWALEGLLRWTNTCPLSYCIDQFPLLRRVLLDEFSKQCADLKSVLVKRSGVLVPNSFLLLALGLRNCTLSEASSEHLAETSQLAEELTQILMLPLSVPPLVDAVNYPELRTYCAEMLDNMGTYITPSPDFLDWLCAGILGEDRSQVLGGLRLMAKMMLGKHDEALELALDHETLLRHVFALLTLPDDTELHSAAAEFLILYCYFLPSEMSNCVAQYPCLLNILLTHLSLRQNQGVDILAERAENPLATIERWLRTQCESNTLKKLSALELFSEYMRDVPSKKLPTLSAAKLIRIVRMIFPDTQVVQLRRKGKSLFFLPGSVANVSV